MLRSRCGKVCVWQLLQSTSVRPAAHCSPWDVGCAARYSRPRVTSEPSGSPHVSLCFLPLEQSGMAVGARGGSEQRSPVLRVPPLPPHLPLQAGTRTGSSREVCWPRGKGLSCSVLCLSLMAGRESSPLIKRFLCQMNRALRRAASRSGTRQSWGCGGGSCSCSGCCRVGPRGVGNFLFRVLFRTHCQ